MFSCGKVYLAEMINAMPKSVTLGLRSYHLAKMNHDNPGFHQFVKVSTLHVFWQGRRWTPAIPPPNEIQRLFAHLLEELLRTAPQ